MTTAVADKRAQARGGSPRQALARILGGNQVQQAVYALTRLGIPDLLAAGPRTSAELARAAGADADALHRLLRALTGFGIVAVGADDRFELTETGALLRSDARGSMRALALWSGGMRYRAFGELEHTVRTGEPGFEHLMGTDFWSYLADDHDARSLFDAMTQVHTAPVAPVIADRDFGDARTVVDVGGGRGDLIAAILTRHAQMRGVLVEHGGAIRGAREYLDGAGVADRCELVEADIVSAVPAAGDVYVMKNVVHGLDDAAAVRAIANCRRAANPGARLLLLELVVAPGNAFSPGKLMDLLMLVGGHGRERTEAEFAALLERAGARLEAVTPAPWGYSVIEAAA
jgi:hypothetical protein